jgi:predicted Zn finger-like uncharacterized protein
MKFYCPACKTAYRIPDEKVSHPAMKTVCKKCGEKMVINRKSGTAQSAPYAPVLPPESAADQEVATEATQICSDTAHASQPSASKPTPPKTTVSVASLASEYPRYRDALIIGSIILVLVVILASVHFLSKTVERSLQELTQNPIQYLTNLITESEMREVCKSFLRHNERRFARLGRGLKFSPVKEEISIVNGKKIAKVIARVHGSKDTRNVIFWLQKRKGRWRILSVALELGKGKYETLYPQAKQQQPGDPNRPNASERNR